MTFFFSPSQLGFYNSDIHSAIPDDAVSITAGQHRDLLQQESDGRVIAANENGQPTTVERVPDKDELLNAMRRRRDALLRESDHTQMADYPMPAELRAAWAAYRQALRDLPETITDPLAINWPQSPAEG